MVIELQQVTKRYDDVTALNEISLEIGTGVFGLVGPNGAGKTTLMRLMAGILQPTAGHIRAFGKDLANRQARRYLKARLGYLPQQPGMYLSLQAGEFLDYMAVLKGIMDTVKRRRQIEDVLAKVGLLDVIERRVGDFSGGMKQRIGIAQALLNDPQLLIVDEPTAGLDPEERINIRNVLSEIGSDRSVILSTHIIEDIGHSANSLALLRDGHLVFHGSPQELIEQADDKVWRVEIPSDKSPPEGCTIIASRQQKDVTQYRLLGAPPESYTAEAVTPSLEDAYMWYQQRH